MQDDDQDDDSCDYELACDAEATRVVESIITSAGLELPSAIDFTPEHSIAYFNFDRDTLEIALRIRD